MRLIDRADRNPAAPQRDIAWNPGSFHLLHKHDRAARPQLAVNAPGDGGMSPPGRLYDNISGGIVSDEVQRSEEHTSELQSLMRTSYAVFCLKKKTPKLTT